MQLVYENFVYYIYKQTTVLFKATVKQFYYYLNNIKLECPGSLVGSVLDY